MHVNLFDCRQSATAEYRGSTLRIVHEGAILLQGHVYGQHPEDLAQRIAKGLGVQCRVVGFGAKETPGQRSLF